jgi:hypothetical protein
MSELKERAEESLPLEAEPCVCRACLRANLLTEIKIARCGQCGKIYCVHFASSIDPSKCSDCLSEVTVIKEQVTKTSEDYDEKKDKILLSKSTAKKITIEGADWLFSQRKICSLSDDALELAIEYHRGICSAMIAEREQRRVEYAHRYSKLRYTILPDTKTSKSTEVKVTKKIKATKAQTSAAGILKAMLASGKDPKELAALLQKALGGVKKK